MANNNDLLPIGTVLSNGKYRILKHLASGGFGKTYIATDTSFDETVAIKELYIRGLCGRDAATGDVMVTLLDNKQSFMSQQEKFRKEAKRLRKLDNQHIVKVRDLFDENGTSYYVMDYIDGESLSERIKRIGRLSEADMMALLPQILDALDAVHKEQIWHLDLKPANIMVDNGGCVKLIDFGASKQFRSSDGATLSTSSTMAYTPGFASAEQMEQNFEKFGPWTDLYSLGATIYYALTLNPPPSPSDINENPTEALKLPSDIGKQMAELVIWLMKPNRMERPKNVSEVSLAISNIDANIKEGDNGNSNEDTIVIKNGDEGNIIKKDKPKNKLWSVIYNLFKVLFWAYIVFLWLKYAPFILGYIKGFLYNKVVDLLPNYLYKIDFLDSNIGVIIVTVEIIILTALLLLIYWHKKTKDQYYQFNKAYKADCNKRYKKAVKWYRKSAEQGNAAAQCNLGYCYVSGQGVEQNYQEAVKLYRKAAEQGNTYAQCNLGVCYEYGQGVEQNYQEAVKWYRKAAEQEDADAQCNLGLCYDYGQGVEQNYQEAVKWYRKAAKQGNARAQRNLGLCYEYGQGVEVNYEEAVKWYRKAAEQGDAVAQYNLGLCYQYGRGVEQNYQEAAKWYRKAAEQGDTDAQNNLGYCYDYGQGVVQNYQEAVKWYRKAAEQGNARAQHNLGYCYYYGQGVEQNLEEAVKWYRKAAEQGNARAQFCLSFCYYEGDGVEQNYQEAVKWIKKVAEQGNAAAQNVLGWLYIEGQGVKRNLDKAKELFGKVLETETEDEILEMAIEGLKEIESRQK